MLFVVSAAPLLAAATLPQDRATAFSIWSSYMPTGGTLALLLAPLALSAASAGAASGWRSPLTPRCAPCCSRAACRRRSSAAASARCACLPNRSCGPAASRCALGFICYVGQWTSLMTWLPTFVVDERGASQSAAALLTGALTSPINIPGNQLGGLLLRARRAALGGDGGRRRGDGRDRRSACCASAAARRAARIACVLAFSVLRRRDPGGGVLRCHRCTRRARSTSAPPTAWSCRPRTSRSSPSRS